MNESFRVIPDTIREQLRRPKQPARPEVAALLEGRTIFLPTVQARDSIIAALRTSVIYRSDKQKTITSRATQLEGEPGVVIWAVDRAVQP